ncbi:hypothetical protein VKT23_007870 [Stygiomarasmius scandens]|uniref:N-acetyltransferase domain-containing protein n=1 Tax=Marasmiellus scandens TaxID=2682957 RepID=A0ABR1JIN0_9AGAR
MYSNLNPKYIVSTIPAPVPTAHLQNYVSTRLLALRTNPDSFSSTHERESAFSTDEWRSRIDPSNRVTFFATQQSDTDATGPPRGEWVALLSTLSPAFFASVNYHPPPMLSVSFSDSDFYIMVGLWVHPSHRRHGLAKRLITGSIDYVCGVASNSRKTLLLAEVHKANDSAAGLYRSMGFEDVGEDIDTCSVWFALSCQGWE